MDHLPGLLLQHVTIGPVARHRRWVEAFEGKAEGSAAQCGLLHITNLLRTVKLVQFFKPIDANVAEGHFDRLYLAGIVQTEKHDFLPGREICAFHRAHRAAELPGQAQLGDGPHDLCVDGRPQRIYGKRRRGSAGSSGSGE